jgi:hypothetical protein
MSYSDEWWKERYGPTKFSKYSEEIKKICIEEHGVYWKTKRKTYRDKNGERQYVDEVDMKHTSKQIFLANWFNRTNAADSILFRLNEWIERSWSHSPTFNCFMVNLFAESQEDLSFDELLEYIKAHKNFNETSSQKETRLEEKKRSIEYRYEKIKKIQSSIGYKYRLFLNKKLQVAYEKLPSLEKFFKKEKIFRAQVDIDSDLEKNLLDTNRHWEHTNKYIKPKPVHDFKNIRKALLETREDWIREILIKDILVLYKKLNYKKSKNIKYKELSIFELWNEFCSLAYSLEKLFVTDDDSDSTGYISRWEGIWVGEKKKDKLRFYKFDAGICRLETILDPEKKLNSNEETKLFTFFMVLYKSIDDEELKTWWNDRLDIEIEEDVAKSGFFAQTIINRQIFHTDLFSLNFLEYRWLEMLEEYEETSINNWDEYIKQKYFFFLKG